MKIPFGGRILLLGCGSVSRCLQPLILRHIEMDFTKLTILDFADLRALIPDTLEAGAVYAQEKIEDENMHAVLMQYVGAGDILIDLAWNIDATDIIQWCHDQGVMYLNTSVEIWDPYDFTTHPTNRTLYVRHMKLRRMVKRWTTPGPTIVVEHGANPGLASHWTKQGLEDIAHTMIAQGVSPEKHARLEQALSERDYPRLAMIEGVKVIHISERDSQMAHEPKRPHEFVNTWSIEGLREEGMAPAEMGWGTHERRLPLGAHVHRNGPRNQICLSQMGMETWVRSWVPSGEIVGMVVRHGEAFTISDYLTVWREEDALYRPTVHYAYLPCDAALASLHEFKMRNYQMQPERRILTKEIKDGRDELGVLLLGHDLNGWWVGSQLDIHETRTLVRDENATTLQVASSILGAMSWMIRNPEQGFNVPDNLPHEEVLAVATPYLGTCLSVQTDWTPLKDRQNVFAGYGEFMPLPEDVWQFDSFYVDI